ncbi:MAG: sensor domain-containing diguanylate cyclase [Acidobacteria bacterium]|nr:sensor domain-containing diguanylate cyclase [Acidobacteriota bacterium]
MAEGSRIGIVYRDRAPELVAGGIPEGMPWEAEFFREKDVLAEGWRPGSDYVAVFFPVDDGAPGLRGRLAEAFPGAEPVGFRTCASTSGEAAVKTGAGETELRVPAPLALVRTLIDGLAAAGSFRREAESASRRADDTRDFLDAFVSALDACARLPGRETALGPLLERIQARIGAEEGALYLPSESGGELECVLGAGTPVEPEAGDRLSVVRRVFESGTPCFEDGCVPGSETPQEDAARSVLRHPLACRGEKVGVIELVSRAGEAFTPEDRTLVEMAAGPLAVAIRTLGRFELSERLTITDDLTLLYNYRYLKKYLEAEVKRCLRYKKKVSLLFIDIDEFKCINDTFGHLVGSRALAEMGQVFKQCVRETDVVGRYGGDEFVIVLPETPLGGAMAVAERIRKRVEGYEFAARNLSIRLTVSLGVANCPRHTLTAEGLIKKADAAMYRAKELSRNSIKVAV